MISRLTDHAADVLHAVKTALTDLADVLRAVNTVVVKQRDLKRLGVDVARIKRPVDERLAPLRLARVRYRLRTLLARVAGNTRDVSFRNNSLMSTLG